MCTLTRGLRTGDVIQILKLTAFVRLAIVRRFSPVSDCAARVVDANQMHLLGESVAER